MQFQYSDPSTKTLSPETRKQIASQLKADINEYCVQEFTGEHRDHLGASLIGQECYAFIWYAFRWAKFQIFDGRMLRLFQRGHEEEKRFVNWLRAIGVKVWDVDPDTGKQFRIYGVQGHYGGSADSVGILPYFPDLPMLLEFKTHNDKSFVHLVNKASVALAKPMHYAQMCSYGERYQFKYGLYVACNKNDDDLYFEVVELDWRNAHDNENKAADVIKSPTRPNRVSENPAYWQCKLCTYQNICWGNEKVEVNCRSCKMAEPVENGEWKCHRYQNIIPKDFIPKGCEYHVSIND